MLISNAVADFAGMRMPNGIFIANDAGDRAGYEMQNGLLIVKSAANSAGSYMTGGTAIISTAKDHAGMDMRGGNLIIDSAKDFCGRVMSGGNLFSNTAKIAFGDSMQGGNAIGRTAYEYAGRKMSGGNLFLEKAEAYAARETVGGNFFVRRTGRNLGSKMAGGVVIAQSIQSIDKDEPPSKDAIIIAAALGNNYEPLSTSNVFVNESLDDILGSFFDYVRDNIVQSMNEAFFGSGPKKFGKKTQVEDILAKIQRGDTDGYGEVLETLGALIRERMGTEGDGLIPLAELDSEKRKLETKIREVLEKNGSPIAPRFKLWWPRK